ncbi:MAG: NUDIX domain-containing protein [Luteitalea sp.]|nr:NUDIX domain-containing protein [Luteitalea sp.]
MSKVLSSKIAYEGRIVRVDVDRVVLPHGREATLEIVRHRGSVVLIPMPDESHVTLVRQYRYAIDRWVWELPAGSLEPGEDPDEAARRECHEEVGLVAGRIERLAAFYPTPGYCDEVMLFYRLTDLQTPTTSAAHDEDELLEPHTLALAELREMLARGEIVDMKTAVGIYLTGITGK